MTLTVEYSGELDAASDKAIIGAALSGLLTCQLDSTYWTAELTRRFEFQVADSAGANAMLQRIQQTGVALSKGEISE